MPYTWQVEDTLTDYRGVSWYWRSFDAPAIWQVCAVRVEFEAVFHTATVWVNSSPVGEHACKGYTAFIFDITHLLHWGQTNVIAVRVDNTFSRHILPGGQSSDWANDGGIFRPVHLLVTPKTFVERSEFAVWPGADERVMKDVEVSGGGENRRFDHDLNLKQQEPRGFQTWSPLGESVLTSASFAPGRYHNFIP